MDEIEKELFSKDDHYQHAKILDEMYDKSHVLIRLKFDSTACNKLADDNEYKDDIDGSCNSCGLKDLKNKHVKSILYTRKKKGIETREEKDGSCNSYVTPYYPSGFNEFVAFVHDEKSNFLLRPRYVLIGNVSELELTQQSDNDIFSNTFIKSLNDETR